MEYSEIEIFKHFLNSYHYIIWKNKSVLGFAAEDDIMNLLDKYQLLDFYHLGENNFKISNDKLTKYVNKYD